jgi:beta-galactosidase
MLYKFNHNYFNNPEYYEQNKLAPRSYFIPFESREKLDDINYLNERYKSDMITMLSGKWDFCFYYRLSDMPREIDSYTYDFESITVPGCWQFQGYEKPFYINTRYQFDCDPPFVPEDIGIYGKSFPIDSKRGKEKTVPVYNTVGIYRKKFQLEHKAKHILTFLGVSSCVQVYCNGRFVGYSEGSHNTAEFDITPFVIDGPNEILCLVYKWCTGTYLECQDMFRNSGIFRDVYVTNYTHNRIWDYDVKVESIDETAKMLIVDVDAVMEKNVRVCYELYYGKKLIAQEEGETLWNYTLEKPYLWSAEVPCLYKLVISLKKGDQTLFCVRQEVGFRKIEIENSVFYYNNMPIKIKGVNHHDTSPKNGFTMSVSEMLKDVELMKLMNVNAVRTSHYPPDPLFIKMANYLGLYIIDEADIETHGTGIKYFKQPNLISNDPRWRDRFWDRVYRMYMRDRNNPCITMWSLGNESGGWKNQDYCYEKLKKLDPSVPIHYEAVCRTIRWKYDVLSQMYTPTERMEKMAAHKLPARYYSSPYFLCEYAHAMGVGPGSLDKYWEIINATPFMMGGCIWEWADHAVLEKDGTYTYGGDHGEYAHDSNFCVDGLMTPDRKPSTSALEMRCVYNPYKITYLSNNVYKITNTNFFADSSNVLFRWEYSQNGEVLAGEEFEATILPLSSYDFKFNHPLIIPSKDCFLNIYYLDKKTGIEMARDQLLLCLSVDRLSNIEADNIACIEENGRYRIATNNGSIIFDKETGNLLSYNIKDCELLSQEENAQIMYPNIFRANVDNYMYVEKKWRRNGLDRATIHFDSFTCNKLPDRVRATVLQRIFVLGRNRMNVTTTYDIYGNGVMDVSSVLDLAKPYDLPKFGLNIELPSDCRNVLYYGRGEAENYSDVNKQSLIGIYSDRVETFQPVYIRPQDCGNRTDVRWAQLTNDEGNGIRFITDETTFNFTTQPYRDEVINKATHSKDVYDENRTVVKIDAFVRGIGTNSCGPDTRVEFRHKSLEPIEYKFRMVPVIKNKQIYVPLDKEDIAKRERDKIIYKNIKE